MKSNYSKNLTLEEYSKTEEAKKIFDFISDEAKNHFERNIKLLIFKEKTGINLCSTSLANLNLPAPMLYTLQAMMSSFAVAAADGPLPFGDALLIASSLADVGTIAIYWKEVAPKWNKIVNVFKSKFGNSVDRVFSYLKSLVLSESTEIERAKSKIPNRLKDNDGNADLNKFNKKQKGRAAYKEKSGWK